MATELKRPAPEELQDELFRRALAPKQSDGSDLQFVNSSAETAYKAAVMRLRGAIRLTESDRVPVALFPSMFPLKFAGLTVQDGMYDYERCAAAFKKYLLEFRPDYQWGATAPGPGKFFEILDYKLYAWPGHGVAPEQSYQCLEDEYMKPEEYDLLLTDPSLFFRNVYLPRVFGALSGFPMLPPWTGILEMYGLAFSFIPFGLPPVQSSYQALFQAGAEALKWAGVMGGFDLEMAAHGFPNLLGGFTKAPFDVLGDTLRGTTGIMTDIFRRPDTLLRALDALTPIMINMGVAASRQTGNPLIFIPLHKGADGFLSDEQFRKFYWPSLQKVIVGLIEAGCVPFPAAEGAFDSRLSVIKDIPKGKTLWMFDRTDIIEAKKVVGDTLCIFGNVPSGLLQLGSRQEVESYVKLLIDKVAPGGGFVLANGAFFDDAKPQNLAAVVETARTYGSNR